MLKNRERPQPIECKWGMLSAGSNPDAAGGAQGHYSRAFLAGKHAWSGRAPEATAAGAAHSSPLEC